LELKAKEQEGLVVRRNLWMLRDEPSDAPFDQQGERRKWTGV